MKNITKTLFELSSSAKLRKVSSKEIEVDDVECIQCRADLRCNVTSNFFTDDETKEIIRICKRYQLYFKIYLVDNEIVFELF